MTINEKGNSKHIAVGCLVANLLTSVTLHIWQERMTALIGASKVTLGGTFCTSTTWMVATPVRPALVNSAALTHASRASIVTSSKSSVVALFDVEDQGTVPLDVAVGKFVLVHRVPVEVHSMHHMNTRGTNILDPILGNGMEHCRNPIEAKVLREEAIVVGMPIHINIGFDCRDDVGIVRQGNTVEGHVRAGPRVIIHVLLDKESEIEFVTMAQFQNVGIPGPPWLLDWDGGVEPRYGKLQNMLEEILAILRFAAHDQYLCLNLQV
jgi:hypothetical protein